LIHREVYVTNNVFIIIRVYVKLCFKYNYYFNININIIAQTQT